MTLTGVKLERFTAFEDLAVEFSPGVNALIGANGTGKTHLMKVCYAACDVSKTGGGFVEKLLRVFLPSGRRSTRLTKQAQEGVLGTAKSTLRRAQLERCVFQHREFYRYGINRRCCTLGRLADHQRLYSAKGDAGQRSRLSVALRGPGGSL